MKLLEFTGESSANNYKQYQKLIQEGSKRSYSLINILFFIKIAAAVCLPRVRILESSFFHQDCRSAHAWTC